MGRYARTIKKLARLQIADADVFEKLMNARDGGPGSGNFGHKGRPGKVGGSSKGEGGSYVSEVSSKATISENLPKEVGRMIRSANIPKTSRKQDPKRTAEANERIYSKGTTDEKRRALFHEMSDAPDFTAVTFDETTYIKQHGRWTEFIGNYVGNTPLKALEVARKVDFDEDMPAVIHFPKKGGAMVRESSGATRLLSPETSRKNVKEIFGNEKPRIGIRRVEDPDGKSYLIVSSLPYTGGKRIMMPATSTTSEMAAKQWCKENKIDPDLDEIEAVWNPDQPGFSKTFRAGEGTSKNTSEISSGLPSKEERDRMTYEYMKKAGSAIDKNTKEEVGYEAELLRGVDDENGAYPEYKDAPDLKKDLEWALESKDRKEYISRAKAVADKWEKYADEWKKKYDNKDFYGDQSVYLLRESIDREQSYEKEWKRLKSKFEGAGAKERDKNIQDLDKSMKEAAEMCKRAARDKRESEVARAAYENFAKVLSEPQQGAPTPEESKKLTEKFLSNISKKLKPYAVKKYQRDLANEPAITKDICEIADSIGARMFGLGFRLKKASDSSDGGCRIDEKIQDDMKDGLTYEQATDKLSDLVRYTQACTPGNLVSNFKKTVAELERKGYKPVKIKNSWKSFNIENAYRGINCVFESPTGTKFELQFHTPESFATKEVNHGEYEEQRSPNTKKERKDELGRIMYNRAKKMQVPKDIEQIENYPKKS